MFLDDEEKMKDFNFLSKDEFLKSYSYLDENEYDETAEIYDCLAEKVKEIANTEQIKELKPQYMNDLEFMNLIGKCRDSNSLMEKRLKEIIDKLVIDGLENTSSGNWIINLRDEKEYLLLRENMRLVENYLKSNEKISDVEITEDEIDLNFYLDYCQSIEIKSYEYLKKQIEDMDNHLLYKGIAMTVLEGFQDEEKDVSLIQIIKATDKIMEQDGAWQNLEECISTVVSDEIHNNKENEDMEEM